MTQSFILKPSTDQIQPIHLRRVICFTQSIDLNIDHILGYFTVISGLVFDQAPGYYSLAKLKHKINHHMFSYKTWL